MLSVGRFLLVFGSSASIIGDKFISTDQDPSLRIESFGTINLHHDSNKLNLWNFSDISFVARGTISYFVTSERSERGAL